MKLSDQYGFAPTTGFYDEEIPDTEPLIEVSARQDFDHTLVVYVDPVTWTGALRVQFGDRAVYERKAQS
jgi:hypothetical protein